MPWSAGMVIRPAFFAYAVLLAFVVIVLIQPIVQGALFPELRRESAESLGETPFDGFAIGGLAVSTGRAQSPGRIYFLELNGGGRVVSANSASSDRIQAVLGALGNTVLRARDQEELARACKELRALGKDVLETREPGGTTTGEKIRDDAGNLYVGGVDSLRIALNRAYSVSETRSGTRGTPTPGG